MTLAHNTLILKHLQLHGSITALDALQMYGCFRLAARIYDLKNQGYQISTEFVTSSKKRYAKYRLIQKRVA